MQQARRQRQAEKRLQQLQLADRSDAPWARPRYQNTKPISMLNSDT